MSAYKLIKFDEEGRSVKDSTLAKLLDQESPFCCRSVASSDIENEFFLEVCSQIGRWN
jgi:hypothetical protein